MKATSLKYPEAAVHSMSANVKFATLNKLVAEAELSARAWFEQIRDARNDVRNTLKLKKKISAGDKNRLHLMNQAVYEATILYRNAVEMRKQKKAYRKARKAS